MKNILAGFLATLCILFLGMTTLQATDLSALKFFPSNGNFLIQIDVQHIQNTQTFKDLYAFVVANPGNQEDIKKFKAEFEIDPLKDIDFITFHVSAETKDSSDFLAVIQGRFNQDKVIQAVEKTWTQTKKEKVGSALMVYSETQKDKSAAFVDGFLILGSQESVKQAVTKTTPFSSALTPLIGQIPKTPLDIWMAVAINKNMQTELKQNNPMAGDFDAVLSTIDMTAGLNLLVKATANNETTILNASNQMNASLQEFLKSPNAMMFASFLSKLKINAKGKELDIQWNLDQQAMNQIKTILSMFLAGMQSQNQAPVNTNPFPTPTPQNNILLQPNPAPITPVKP